ncbi:MAG: hypothetical protein CMA08_02355 [Euryarchaeota archaeon]|nr:hypothetical protein [Euryarchaeota archaeon]OUX22617.1 MAG: hypothetical protein CBE12_01790 [Euryarchaeota archaeon TMED252]
MRSTLVVTLLALFLLPCVSASINVPGGYVSTAPLVSEDHVLIRSSGTFDGSAPPMVRAYGENATLHWVIEGPATSQPDMADVVHVEGGTGPCGTWSDRIVIAWSSGLLEARAPDTGLLLWQANTTVQTWGLTATPVLVDEGLLITTRSGVEIRCPTDGALLHATETGLGWRNPASMVNGTVHVGDESGRLWSWTPGEAPSFVELGGAIRHAPLHLNGGLVVHVQTGRTSMVEWLPLGANGQPQLVSEAHRLASGASPGMPVLLNETSLAIADFSGLQVLTWSAEGWDVTRLASTSVQGPLRFEQGRLTASENGPNGGFLAFDVAEAHAPIALTTGLRGYGTAPPVACGDAWLLVKDEGKVVLEPEEGGPTCPLSVDIMPSTEQTSVDKSPAVWTLSLMAAFLAGATAGYRRGPLHALRWASPFLLVAFVALMPSLMGWWVDQAPQPVGETVWDDTWPDDWREGHVVVFELPNETLAIGGLEPRPSALEATVAAADELDVSIALEDHALGRWVTAIDGVAADGWVYEVDGVRPAVGPEAFTLDRTSVVVWSLA